MCAVQIRILHSLTLVEIKYFTRPLGIQFQQNKQLATRVSPFPIQSLLYVPLPHKMCRFQVGEDDLLTGEDFSRSIGNGIGRVDTTIQTQIAILEQRIARVEAQMEGVKDSLFRLQMSVCILGIILWVTLAFVILK
ncbi:hypothetical protein LguiA_004241 [Lonicera macranthoides]